jgi:hypothetical protein
MDVRRYRPETIARALVALRAEVIREGGPGLEHVEALLQLRGHNLGPVPRKLTVRFRRNRPRAAIRGRSRGGSWCSGCQLRRAGGAVDRQGIAGIRGLHHGEDRSWGFSGVVFNRKPRSYWGVVLALGLAFPLLAQEPIGAISGDGQNDQQSQPHSKADAKGEPSFGHEALPQSKFRVGGNVGALAYELIGPPYPGYPDCPYDSVEECDLLAQKAMAQSTWWMNSAAWAGLILSFIGLALIARTMLYTRDAADYAKRAAVAAEATVTQAELATAAANATVETTRDIGNTQLRAWVSVFDYRMAVIPVPHSGRERIGAITFTLVGINTGSTPALQMKYSANHAAGRMPELVDHSQVSDDLSAALGPQAMFQSHTMHFDPETVMASSPGPDDEEGPSLYLKCSIQYRDLFSTTVHQTVRTIRINYIGVADLRICGPNDIDLGNFAASHAGENVMT